MYMSHSEVIKFQNCNAIFAHLFPLDYRSVCSFNWPTNKYLSIYFVQDTVPGIKIEPETVRDMNH